MAIVSCYECKRQISTAAASCPHCGAPNDPRASPSAADRKLGYQVFGLLFLVTALIASVFNHSPTRSLKSPSSSAEASESRGIPAASRTLRPDTATLSRDADSAMKQITFAKIPAAGAGALLHAVNAVESAPHTPRRDRWLAVAREQANRKASEEAKKNVNSAAGDGSTQTRDGYYGCVDYDTFRELSRYLVDKDLSAAAQLVVTGECIALPAGKTVEIVDTKILSGVISIRFRGSRTALWTNMEAVR